MEQIEFPQDFSEFLKLLNAHRVEYLLIGGFAVTNRLAALLAPVAPYKRLATL